MRSLIGRDAMGHGDLKLLAALGAWLGWQALPWVLLLACFLGLVFAMWRQKSFRPRGEHPFGPFLAGCAAGVFLAPTAVPSWFCYARCSCVQDWPNGRTNIGRGV